MIDSTPLALVDRLLDAALAPVRSLQSPESRMWWLYLLLAALLGTAVWAVKLRHRVRLWRFLFPKSIWLHPSALLDYRLLFARAVIDGLFFAPLAVSSTYVALSTLGLLTRHLGGGPLGERSPALAIAALTVSTFVAEDLARYVVHRLAHRVPALWQLHKVHHSAEVLTPITVYRTHPLERLLMRSGAAVAIGVAAGVSCWLFRRGASGWEIAGVNALGFVWTGLGANLRHSQVWLSYGRWLEHLFISPAQHQVHHSSERGHYDRNFGSALALWDWLGGTLYVTGGRERLRFGLPPDMKNHGNSVISTLIDPLIAIARSLRLRA